MFRSIAAASAPLLLMLTAASAAMAPPADGPAVKLWIDTGADNPCEQSTPASGGWMIRNNENRNVHVVLQRVTTKSGSTTEDRMQDTLGPREIREMGCEISDDSHQALSVVKVSF